MGYGDPRNPREASSEMVIGAAITVHRILGPGLLESANEACLAHELEARGAFVERQVPLPLRYGSLDLDCGHRADLVVDRAILVEVKAVEHVRPVHEAQLRTYLRLSGLRIGLLFHFHALTLVEGIRRVVAPSSGPSGPSSLPSSP